jgi:DNA-binding response OmpR family regulator
MARKILSINGNRSMNYLLKTITRNEYNLITVLDAVQAMWVLKKEKKIDCILIDVDYHTEQNLEFIQLLQNSFLYQCPIIILSSNKETDKGIMPTDNLTVFFKPFDPMDLKDSIAVTIRPVHTE